MSGYKRLETDFHIFALSYIAKEGIGLHASFSVWGTLLVKDGYAYLTGRLRIPLAMAGQEIRPTINPSLRATLSKASGEQIMSRRFQDDPQGSIIPSDWQSPMEIYMGSADFLLPSPPERLLLDVSGNVQYGFDEGFVMARNLLVPHKTFTIEVEE